MTPEDEKRIRENPYNGTVVTELLAALDAARSAKEQAEARLQAAEVENAMYKRGKKLLGDLNNAAVDAANETIEELITENDRLQSQLASSVQYSKTLDENYRKLQLQLSRARTVVESCEAKIKELFGGMGRGSAIWGSTQYDKGYCAGVQAALGIVRETITEAEKDATQALGLAEIDKLTETEKK